MSSSTLRNVLDPKTKILTSPGPPASERRALLTDPDTPLQFPSTPAWLQLNTPSPLAAASHIALTFQGGFVATKIAVSVAIEDADGAVQELVMSGRIYPQDTSKRQVFQIPYPPQTPAPSLRQIKLDLEATSDNQGRIVLYTVEILSSDP